MSVFSSRFEDYGSGQRTPVGGLSDEALMRKFRHYRRTVAKRYRVVFAESIGKFLPPGPLWISTKVDGELWFLVKRAGELALCAYNGRVVTGVPVCAEAEKLLAGVDDIVIPGELFAIPGDGAKRPRCHHVARALSDGELAPTLGFKAFDLLEQGDQDWLNTTYGERLERLNSLLGTGKRVAVITTVEGEPADAAAYYQEWVRSEKFEGVVVRSQQGFTYKIKPSLTLDAVIIAFGERTIDGLGQIRELTVALKREDGSFHILGTVGNGWSDADRVDWHHRLSQIEAPSSFRMANREGTLCRFVRPQIVIEIKCSDLIAQDTDDAPVRRMALRYDAEAGFSPIGPMPIVSMLHPVFVREREDKLVDVGNVGLDQIYQHILFETRNDLAGAEDFPQSEIVRRGVYTKVTKGQVAVRKYVAIATNKADIDPNYPPYVVHFTDYSAGRKAPLQTNLRVAASLESLDVQVSGWLEENIKKGWNEA
ncbi:MAG: hypothetical protein H0U74_00740 [Bradymonadaceae bacterium]|nr:hypothetical protein [Lujinxingiaceae bacterium]